ncbi:MAG: DMT family transporter [Gammaproteobacteria bacterium]
MVSAHAPARRERIDAFGASLLVGFSVLLGLNQALVKLVNAGFSPLFQAGLRSASRVSLFFYTMPLWVAVGAHCLIATERLTVPRVLGLGLALLGIALALLGGDQTDPGSSWVGDGLALAASLCWAGIALLTRTTRLQETSPEMNLLYQLAVSTIVILPLAPLFGDVIREPTGLIYGIFAFQVIVVVAIGFVVWFWILSLYPVSNMASFSLLTPVFGIFFGWWVFDDALPPTFLAALGLVGAGLVLVNRR